MFRIDEGDFLRIYLADSCEIQTLDIPRTSRGFVFDMNTLRYLRLEFKNGLLNIGGMVFKLLSWNWYHQLVFCELVDVQPDGNDVKRGTRLSGFLF